MEGDRMGMDWYLIVSCHRIVEAKAIIIMAIIMVIICGRIKNSNLYLQWQKITSTSTL